MRIRRDLPRIHHPVDIRKIKRQWTCLFRSLPRFRKHVFYVGTMHVKTVTLLSQREVKDKATVVIDDLMPTKVEMKPTYDEIRKYVFDKYGVNVTSLNIAKAKTEFGVKERENYNLPKSDNPRQPNLTPEKKKMIKEALEHFKMI